MRLAKFMKKRRVKLRPSVYIAMEFKNRELDSQLYLASKLIQKKYRVYIGSHAAIFSLMDVKKHKAGLYFDKGTLPSKRMQNLSLKNDYIAILDQELGPNIDEPKNHLEGWPSRIYPNSEKYIDLYFCASDRIFLAAKDRFKNYQTRVLKTGWPRFDLWDKRWQNLYGYEINKIKKLPEFLLFISDFGISSKNSTRVEGLECMSVDDPKFKTILELIKKFDKNPNIPHIVIRPHISEDVKVWKKALGNSKKITITKKFSVTPWVMECIALLHTGSTVALEAKLLEKKVYFLKPSKFNDKSELSKIMSDEMIEDNTDLSTLTSISHDTVMSELQSKFIKNRLQTPGNITEKIVNIISALQVTPEEPISPTKLIFSKISITKILRILGLVRHEILWKLSLTAQPPYSHFFPGGLSRSDIRRILLFEKDINLRVRKSGKNCWRIEMKRN